MGISPIWTTVRQRTADFISRKRTNIHTLSQPLTDLHLAGTKIASKEIAMHPINLLVVDDDSLICWGFEKEFTPLGITTRVVERGADALSELRKQTYDTVFLDLRLPDANGLDLLPEIAKIAPETKVVVMSGNANEMNRQLAFAGGAVKFLEKPFDLSEVHAILKDAMAGRLRKRKHPRSECRIPLSITNLTPAPEEARDTLTCVGGIIANVGSGGFRIRTKYPLAVGQSIGAQVDAAGDDPCVNLLPPQATAEVVWVEPSHDGVTAGLKFLP